MFKNAFFYRLNKTPDSLRVGTVALNFHMFEPCGATQEKSMGWVPPRGQEHGALLESIGGQHILKLMTETKAVPAAVIKRGVDALAASIEKATGRKPGKKERREMADEVRQNCLPHAFAKQSAIMIWIDPAEKMLVIDASSQGKADDAITMLVKTFDGIELQLINTVLSPAAGMAHWLVDKEAPDGFSIDRECELKARDESKAVVKYGHHPLDIDEVAQHMMQGKMPTKLALTYDSRVSFVLTEGLQIKKIQLLDLVFANSENENAADSFDADVAIFTGEKCQTVRRVAYSLRDDAKPLAFRQPVVTTCGERLCVNPAHLKSATHKEVSRKAGAAGRMSSLSKGQKVAKSKRATVSKLPGGIETARVIRMSTETGPVLAARYGVNKAVINRIKNGTSWKDYSNPFMGLMA